EAAAAATNLAQEEGTASAPASRESRASPAQWVEKTRVELDRTVAAIEALDAKIRERLTYRFGDDAVQFKHDTLRKLVADLAVFLDQDPKTGAVASVRERLAFAESVERRTITKYKAEWDRAIASIADPKQCPKYNGL